MVNEGGDGPGRNLTPCYESNSRQTLERFLFLLIYPEPFLDVLSRSQARDWVAISITD